MLNQILGFISCSCFVWYGYISYQIAVLSIITGFTAQDAESGLETDTYNVKQKI